MLETAESVVATFVIFALIFVPLERAFPLRKGQTLLRAGWKTDLLFFLGNALLWTSCAVAVLLFVRSAVIATVPDAVRETFALLPWGVQILVILLLGDCSNYWFHRFQHRSTFLWRTHAVHHTSSDMDWLAAQRVHPVDLILTQLSLNLPAFIVGFSISAVAGLVAFRGLWALYIHSNINIPLGGLELIVGAPQIHHWHHIKDKKSCNYGNLSPLMDVIFGTYHPPTKVQPELGIAEAFPSSYAGQLAYPLRLKGRDTDAESREPL